MSSVLLFGLGVAGGVVAGLTLGRRIRARRRMPFLRTWQRVLAEERGEVEAARLAARVQSRYDELYASRPRIVKRALRSHLEMNILPALALYQTLRAGGAGEAEAVSTLESCMWRTYETLLRPFPFLRRLPNAFGLFRGITRQVLRLGFPPEGWEMEMIEDSERLLAFDIHRCFYLDVLTAYGAPELTAIFCQTDDWLAEALSPSIAWERTRTLGRGDECCDYAYRRAGP
jgi:hypothetical protein